MGESFGTYQMGQDEALMDLVSSVNIACGFHAGDPDTMYQTVLAAVRRGIAIGAHPGYPDLQGFGRRDMAFSPDEVYRLVLYQIGALSGFAKAAGHSLTHVKPHGALYNAAAKEKALATSIARAVRDFDPGLRLVGLSGSLLVTEAEGLGLRAVSEVFADRTYQEDGSLTPRTNPKALIKDPVQAAQQVLQMVTVGTVTTLAGNKIPVKADSVCIHGDGPHALSFAQAIRSTLDQHQIEVRHPG